jgi:hypothetical protein
VLGLGAVPALNELMANRERDGLVGSELINVVWSSAQSSSQSVYYGGRDGLVVILERLLHRREGFFPLGSISREDVAQRLVALGDESYR